MPLLEISEADIRQRCAACGSERRIALGSLEAGVDADGQVQERIVRLPSCGCGAQEFLLRSADDEPAHPAPGSFGHLHRLLVDHLHGTLIRGGRVVGSLQAKRATQAKGTGRDVQQELDRWFPSGLRIDPADIPGREKD